MYGLIGKMPAAPDKREELLALLLGGSETMPGCSSYITARDPGTPDGIWITAVWSDSEKHRASLQLPQVQPLIGQGASAHRRLR